MNDKKRILIITDTYIGIPGGSERHLFNFCKGVSDQFEIHAYQLIPTLNPMLEDGSFFGRNNITLYSKPISSLLSLSSFKLILELVRLIQSSQIQMVISYHEKSDILNYLLKCIFRSQVSSITSKRDMGFKLTGRLRWAMKKILPSFDGITCPSSSIKDLLISEFSAKENKVCIINNGVELENYLDQGPGNYDLMIKQLSLPKNCHFITIVGCLKEVKGHSYLIEGFADFLSHQRDSKNWMLLVLGEGDLRLELMNQAKSLKVDKNIMFTGYQNNVHDWLNISDIVVSASLSEGLSNALVEACAAGCAIIATNVGGNPEVVTNGENGLLVEAKSSSSISDALSRLVLNESLLIKMGENSRLKATELFSNTAMVEKLEQYYSNTLMLGVK